MESKVEKNFSPNWLFVGNLKDVSSFTVKDKSYFLLKTATTVLPVEASLIEPIHIGQTVKISKRDNAVKIGSQFFYRPVSDEVSVSDIEVLEEA